MIRHTEIDKASLHSKIRHHELTFAGNGKLKIYGTLSCSSGKKMKQENRLFFTSEQEALERGYRPCGNCMKKEYHKWICSTH
ncbi:Ada metal-binding domain-containing protein [Prolixibacter sp. NT017]|uniref:Ada metal-binding domain-containing protein n=1 Tax=Prolixibacter sp. NT017 TaxID=2652390 RepID=UPI0012994287|nr:Ada metal-binding domain-containing protein [Prolixibacter sp. NT017]